MDPIIRLLKFHLNELSVQWAGEHTEPDKIEYRYSMDYHVWEAEKSGQLFKLQLILRVEPENEKKGGYTINGKITGFFVFPESTDAEKIPVILCLNGNSILYGILRGQIASLTGLCEAGMFTLATINMKETVERIEKVKAESTRKMPQVARPVKKPTKKERPRRK